MILKPIKGEEWIEKMREKEFWRSEYPWEPRYARFVRSYVGWQIYYRVRSIWPRAALLFDPLSCGGFYSHLRSFLYNWIMVDIVWNLKYRVWKLFHKKQWEQQMRMMRAYMQATEEGCADPMGAPESLPDDRFHGIILGERYFKRVAEIMQEGDEAPPARPKL